MRETMSIMHYRIVLYLVGFILVRCWSILVKVAKISYYTAAFSLGVYIILWAYPPIPVNYIIEFMDSIYDNYVYLQAGVRWVVLLCVDLLRLHIL